MYTYARCTKLSDVGGRSDYITNKTGRHAAEDVLCVGGPTSDWQPYANYEQAHQRSSERNNEGRELIIALPNSWGSFIGKALLKSRVDSLTRKLLGKATDYQFAVHWNGSHTNLHAHIIFSERTKCSQTNAKGSISDFYDRDIYLTQDGKIARRKADRALDGQGNVKPPVHRKGEPKNTDFSAKDKKYKSKAWLQDVKATITRTFALEKDKKHVPNYLHTYHEGKAPKAAERVRQENAAFREINQNIERLRSEGYKFPPLGDKAYNLCAKNRYDARYTDYWLIDNISLNGAAINQQKAAAEQKEAQKSEQVCNECEYLAERIVLHRLFYAASRSGLGYDFYSKLIAEHGLVQMKERDYVKACKKFHKLLPKLSQSDGQHIAKYVSNLVRSKLTGNMYNDYFVASGNKIIEETTKHINVDRKQAYVMELPSITEERQERERRLARGIEQARQLEEYKKQLAEKEKNTPKKEEKYIPPAPSEPSRGRGGRSR